jgi:hypothetical protein
VIREICVIRVLNPNEQIRADSRPVNLDEEIRANPRPVDPRRIREIRAP